MKKTQKKTYVKPALFNQGSFGKKTAGYFYGSYKEFLSRRIV
ncbi:keywimysin-related RiPP [Streptomyces sp. TRM 70361]|nr:MULTISPECIES: keywimysin-related RiPP [Streptomyces]MEE1938008.1 keywimysin-related RiPP [Streptomyces sp. TRM 70361]